MINNCITLRTAFAAIIIGGIFSACKKEDVSPNSTPTLRIKIDYSLLSDTLAYGSLFKDANGDSTVDRTEGRNLFLMFRALNSYASSGISANVELDSIKLRNLYSNTGSPFSGTFPGTNADALNNSNLNLGALTASSNNITDAEIIRIKIERDFGKLATTSKSITEIAEKGKAGKLGSYLVDAKGIEYIQIIQKSLIGAFQLDYIGNVLLSEEKLIGTDNSALVSGKKYSVLEHNWDMAYGAFTIKDRYASAATPVGVSPATNGGESFLGAYIWEYNKTGYLKIHPAFLKGRAAIVNNDMTELKVQAKIIRTESEKAIAAAAVGYLNKWKTAVASTTNSVEAVRAHAIGEAVGFIYSLRFCKLNNCDRACSEEIINSLIYSSADGFWDLENEKVNDAISKINTKFAL